MYVDIFGRGSITECGEQLFGAQASLGTDGNGHHQADKAIPVRQKAHLAGKRACIQLLRFLLPNPCQKYHGCHQKFLDASGEVFDRWRSMPAHNIRRFIEARWIFIWPTRMSHPGQLDVYARR